MKSYKIITIVFFLCSLFVNAQQKNKEKIEKIKSLKIAYITKEIDLSKDEAEKFWPIYNTFDEKQFEIRHKKMRAIMDKLKGDGLNKIDEKEAATILNQMDALEEELIALRKKFVKDAKEVIGAKKVLKLRKVEEEFNRTLLKQYKGKGKSEE